jgi:hypothetical protein
VYLARFETESGTWLQATAALHANTRDLSNGQGTSWHEVTDRIRLVSRAHGTTVALRIALNSARKLVRSFALLTAAEHERLLRLTLAGLTRIERRGATVFLPLSAQEHDALLAGLPPLRTRTAAEAFAVGGVPLALDFRFSPLLDDLLVDACYGGYRLAYQAHFRAGTVDPECIRSSRKSLLGLDGVRGLRPTLLEWQRTQAREQEHAAGIIEEFLLVDDVAHAAAIAPRLRDAFHARYAQYGLPAPRFDFVENGWEEGLQIGIHSHDVEPMHAMELCGAAVAAEERDRILGWTPSARLATLLMQEEETSEPEEVRGAELPAEAVPPVYEGAAPYAFVSYKRQDFERIVPIIHQVNALGLPVWYDRGIPGGAEWDAIIEERLSRAAIVLLFSSAAAVQSKYVRREVKFADALDTPVLTILLEDAQLGQGMKMLLTQYQILDARASDFAARLRRALEPITGRL